MDRCIRHVACLRTYVQTPEDVDTLLRCMVTREVLTIHKGVYRRSDVEENGANNKV